jgi:superfamily II DNA or RNA helicase/HKD family nuclease
VTDVTPGPRDHLVTRALRRALGELDPRVVDIEHIDAAEAPERLARHLAAVVRRILAMSEEATAQADVVNDLLQLADGDMAVQEEIPTPPQILTGIRALNPLGDVVDPAPLPATPLGQSDLLVNAVGQPNIGSELRAELATAERVELICAFVIWSGVVQLRDAIRGVVERGGSVRVITTTYMGATEKRAVDELVRLGAEVKVALDARTTKLHAKAWLLERGSGLTTAFIGSSNLSHTALFDGLEWNVRLSAQDAPHVIDRVRAMFESHWASEHFDSYHPDRNGKALEQALGRSKRGDQGFGPVPFAGIDVHPYPHQRRMLEALTIERERHDRHRNLVVAATGTGKTVVAALDYEQLEASLGPRPSLLFVAHREEILRQSMATYRAVLRDPSFGELHGGGRVAQGRHVFAMIQSLRDVDEIDPRGFEVVVVDEFHHAAAASYDRLLRRLEPSELLGLTATPERLDGKDVTEWFGSRIAVELRLWEAIDEGFLVPFQYFGVADGTDLRSLTWRRGRYVTSELERVFTADDRRVVVLLRALRRVIADPTRMRALGFCVSIDHAKFMARKFREHGLPSVALSGEDSPEQRDEALNRLRAGDLRCIFSVEVLGEGVDVPDVDTILLLRPTQSATVFTQQLGRGLRRARGKSHLTVVDLIGQQHREFRFAERLRAIVDPRRGAVVDQVERGFPFLPAGCAIDLDRQSTELILENLRSIATLGRWRTLVDDLAKQPDDGGLNWYLERTGRQLEDVYRGSGKSWTLLRRDAARSAPGTRDATAEAQLFRAFRRLRHIDDPERVSFYRDVLERPAAPRSVDHDERERRLLRMLSWGLWGPAPPFASVDEAFLALWRQDAIRSELGEFLAVLDKQSTTRAMPSVLDPAIPLTLHARYSRVEIIAALGHGGDLPKPPSTREGVLWVESARSDVFFIDLHKAERDYSPTTMYRDYAINRELFHWESQSRQAPGQPSVQRYIEHDRRGTQVLLMVRERKRDALGEAAPYAFLGPAHYVSHEGARPVQFTWRLPLPMPEELFEVARTVAAA